MSFIDELHENYIKYVTSLVRLKQLLISIYKKSHTTIVLTLDNKLVLNKDAKRRQEIVNTMKLFI